MRLLIFSVLVCLFCLEGGNAFSRQRDMGESVKHSSSVCHFEGSYTRGRDYDVKTSLSRVKVSVAKPFVLRVILTFFKLEPGAYTSLAFYDPHDKEHGPIPDLSYTGTDEQVAASSFIQLKAFGKSGRDIALAPVIYKKGYRGIVEDKEQYFNPFLREDAVTDEEGRELGGPGNLFTTLFVKIAGKGTYKAFNFQEAVFPNKGGEYRFLVHLDPNIGNELFIIAAITKAAIMPADRGLRSPIVTTPLNISRPC